MKLAVVTCAVFPTEEDARKKLWIYLRSCAKFNIEPMMYGTGRIFPNYKIMMLDWNLEYMKTIPKEYSHLLYSDSWDCFFCAPLDEIIEKYRAMGSPSILQSAYIGLGNESDMSKYVGCFDESIPYRYPNVGAFMGEREALIDAFQRMVDMPEQTGDNCFNVYTGWREGWFRPMLDSNCEIFQVSDVNAIVDSGFLAVPSAKEKRPRLLNTTTGSHPCILHLSGGYTDQVTGKDHVMVPWARALWILE